jgi:hypothetical protein
MREAFITLVVYLTFCLVLQTELLDEYADAEKGSERVALTDTSHFGWA